MNRADIVRDDEYRHEWFRLFNRVAARALGAGLLTPSLLWTEGSSPIGNLVVLQELTPHVLAGQESGENRVADPGCCVDLIERRTKAEDFGFVLSNRGRILIGNPTRIDAVHVDAVSSVILGGRSRQ